ncbi:MAG: hypothetical protein ACERKD_01390 [Prolixibacteraceae bacterium]
MAVLSITLKENWFKRSFKAKIYSNDQQIGEVVQGATEEFKIDDSIQVIQARKGIFASPKIEVNHSKDGICLFKVFTHPAIRLIRISLIISTLFLLAFLLFFEHELKLYIGILFFVPVLVLFTSGLIFCKKNYFVVKEVNRIQP